MYIKYAEKFPQIIFKACMHCVATIDSNVCLDESLLKIDIYTRICYLYLTGPIESK